MYRRFFVLAVGVVFINAGLILAHDADGEGMMDNMTVRGMDSDRSAAPGMNPNGMMGMGMAGGNMMQQGMMPMGMMPGVRWGLVADQLDLSDKQREELAQTTRKLNRDMIEINNELRLKNYDLNEELEKEDINESAIDKLIDNVSGLQKKRLTLRKENLLKVKDIFSNDQWEKFQKIRNGSMGMKQKSGMQSE